MPVALPALLAAIAGAVDAISFLSLSGLFAAHITGNFVLLGATLVLGHPAGVWSKVAAPPAFVACIAGSSFIADRLHLRKPLRPLLAAEFVLLLAGLAIFATQGPFRSADEPWALAAGFALVAAMALQNTLGVLGGLGLPPTTVMTTNMARLFSDLGVLSSRADTRRPVPQKVRQQAWQLGWEGSGFLLGCAAGAACHVFIQRWALAVPTGCLLLVLLLPPVPAATSR